MISNTNKQGYGISLSPNAKTNDGILNLIYLKKSNIFNLFYLIILVLLRFSIKKKSNVKYMELREFKITSKNNYINLQIDGEFVFSPKNELVVSVIPDAINVLC